VIDHHRQRVGAIPRRELQLEVIRVDVLGHTPGSNEIGTALQAHGKGLESFVTRSRRQRRIPSMLPNIVPGGIA
jgi:hypothetical protein